MTLRRLSASLALQLGLAVVNLALMALWVDTRPYLACAHAATAGFCLALAVALATD